MSLVSIDELFKQATSEGDISPQSLQALNIVDVGQQLQGQLGLAGLNLQTRELLLFGVLLDDSSSIQYSQNAQAVRDGYNSVLNALKASHQRDSVVVYTRQLNGGVIDNWVLLENATHLDSTNYNPQGSTALYDESCVLYGSVLAEVQRAKNDGQLARAGILIVSDGADTASRKSSSSAVYSLSHDLLNTETCLIGFLGVDDGSTDFYGVGSGHSKQSVELARSNGTLNDLEPIGGMGIYPRWIMTPKSDPSEIRKAFGTFSSSMIRASQTGSFI